MAEAHMIEACRPRNWLVPVILLALRERACWAARASSAQGAVHPAKVLSSWEEGDDHISSLRLLRAGWRSGRGDLHYRSSIPVILLALLQP